ncbi:MAG: hypothetical protein IPM85_13440 [Chitinophagaceae bacterium]|nr:hypothetical protein [Chitinophagaceae bacterium]
MKLHYFLNISNPTSAIFKKINLYTDRASGLGLFVNPNTKPVAIGSTPPHKHGARYRLRRGNENPEEK